MTRKRRAGGIIAAGITTAMLAAACGNGGGTDAGAADNGDNGAAENGAISCPASITLDIGSSAFADQNGADLPLIAEFGEKFNTTVTVNRMGESTDVFNAVMAGLAVGGAGIGDLVGIEGDNFAAVTINPDDWVTLPEIEGRWLDWAEDEGRVDGKLLGYRTDIGPTSVMFNAQLLIDNGFEQYAEPDAFGEWIGGANATWDTFLDAGREFHEATGIAWVDSISDGPMRAALRQLPAAFENPDTGLPTDLAQNTKVHDIFLQMTGAMTEGLGAGTPFWDGEWGAAMLAGEFATMVAPPWQLGWPLMASGAGTDMEGAWRIAPTFPNGGANWGGTFMMVPAHTEARDCAIALADWLTNDQTAVAAWENQGAFPSQVAVLKAGVKATEAQTNFLGGQDMVPVLTALAEAIPSATFRGEHFQWIQDTGIFNTAATVQDGINTPEAAWDAAVAAFNGQGFELDQS